MRRICTGCVTFAFVLAAACWSDNPTATVEPEQRGSVLDKSASTSASRESSENRKIAVLDNCDPHDAAWAPTGGCVRRGGDVTNAEFGAFLRSPLTVPPNGILVGHPSWRNEPSYLSMELHGNLRVKNEGGRLHTFTEVAQFGGGRVPPLNIGLTPAPECAGAVNLAPGAQQTFGNLSIGVHRFMCCIHPWMRAVVRVSADD